MTNLAALLDATSVADWEVAAACRIHPSALSHYRRGTRAIHERHAALLADWFGVSLEVIRDQAVIPWEELEARAAQSSPASSSG